MSDNLFWLDLDQKYIMNTFKRYPIAVEKIEGHYIIDVQGKKYLDLVTGLGVNMFGYLNGKLNETIQKQIKAFLHTSNLIMNPHSINLAKKLVEASFPDKKGKVFFTTSGTEATEAALKIIHRFHNQKQDSNHKDKSCIAVIKKAFHGRTSGAFSLAPYPKKNYYPSLPFKIFKLPLEDILYAKNILEKEKPIAIFMEPILGSGGILTLSKSYMKNLNRIAQANNITIVLDEIQTGMGRTGYLFGHQYAGIVPDLILFGKGIGGGLPLGGVIANDTYSDILNQGDHGSTFAPSPLAVALGETIMDLLLKENSAMLLSIRKKAHIMTKKLRTVLQPYYKSLNLKVRGRGLMLGIWGDSLERIAQNIQKQLLANGFLINITGKNILRLLPPLTLQENEWDMFLEALDKCLKKNLK